MEKPVAVAEVVNPVLARFAGVQRQQVGDGEVGDVDVVADAGAVRGWVVVAEDLDRRRAARAGQRHLSTFGIRWVSGECRSPYHWPPESSCAPATLK